MITNEQIEQIAKLYYSDESFRKFNDSTHPLFEQYKDRKIEEAMDRGNNNAIECILSILLKTSMEIIRPRLIEYADTKDWIGSRGIC